MIMPTWLDRPLSVAGRILVRTENGIRSLLVHPDRALAVIPNLCIHFSHDLNNGMKYNPQVDLQPIFGEAGSTLRDALAEERPGSRLRTSWTLTWCSVPAKRPSAWA